VITRKSMCGHVMVTGHNVTSWSRVMDYGSQCDITVTGSQCDITITGHGHMWGGGQSSLQLWKSRELVTLLMGSQQIW
jgi:hypothetical protein